MGENRNPDPERAERLRQKRELRRKKQRRAMIRRAIILAVLCAALVVCIVLLVNLSGKKETASTASVPEISSEAQAPEPTEEASLTETPESSSEETSSEGTEEATGDKAAALNEASALAVMYDYDGAIERLNAYGDTSDSDIAAAIASYTSAKENCYAVDVTNVPHIFFHSLMNDNRGLIVSDQVTEGRVTANNAAMCTVDEFNHVINQMYEAGYVMITLDDLVVENEDGTFSNNTELYLPEGKKAFILSEDDLSYYHSYGENGAQGYADKLVIDENGDVKCQYVDKEGVTHIGDYDMVPLINTFIREHPDFVYKNARPTIALTGYNGIFGYVTNTYYKDGGDYDNLSQTQIDWLESHPDYDYDTDCANARQVAEALKAEGWTFASHTYGHLDANEKPLESLQADQERWKLCVGDIIGGTDKIIFAFGADIGDASQYSDDNAKYAYYKSEGYRFFCNCDGTLGWSQLTSEYVRTGRFAIDGFTLYQAMTPDAASHDRCASNYEVLGVHDIASFFDPDRTTPIDSE